MEYEMIATLAKDAGFTHVAPLNPETIELKEEVRQMCEACGRYGKCWSCPPGCGTLEECRQRVQLHQKGILVQTVGQLEDEFDGEAMMETQEQHKIHFRALCDKLQDADVLKLGAGCCTICKECSYPDAPCRFPEKMVSSMESYGMVVAEVCKANNVPYYYGKNTIAYTSCILF
jgi:predicted metal-binding protein